MDLMQAIKARHSVRSYIDRPLEPDVASALEAEISRINKESGLSIQLVVNEPQAFDSMMAKYGKFSGVCNYIALVGDKKMPDLDERCGYFGEKLVLLAQQLGLNTCWVGMTFKKVPSAYRILSGQKLVIVIALGYGETQGVSHKVKSPEEVSANLDNAPEWFRQGVDAVLLAPTAVNQQKFLLEYLGGNEVSAKTSWGFFSKVDLGIAKCHFEIGASPQEVIWR